MRRRRGPGSGRRARAMRYSRGGNRGAWVLLHEKGAVARARPRPVRCDHPRLVACPPRDKPPGGHPRVWRRTMTQIPADDPTTRLFLRHTLATLAYRAAKTVRGTPAAFGEYRAS